MLDEIKKGLMAGFGSLFLTKDKIEAATKKLVEEAKLSREDAQKLAEELVSIGEQRWAEVEKAIGEVARKGMETLDYCRRSELAPLQDKIEELTKRISEIERQQRTKVE